LHDTDPDVGRVLARRPGVVKEDFDVVAYPIPSSISRRLVRKVLIRRLSKLQFLSDEYVGDPSEVTEGSNLASGFVEEIMGSLCHLLQE
jgi:hypothetical protein